MKRWLMAVPAILFLTSCVGLQQILVPDPLVNLRDGHYDNHPLLVDPKTMSLPKVIGSVRQLRTEVKFKKEKDGQVLMGRFEGTGIVLFGRYILTVRHVVVAEPPMEDTPFGEAEILGKKIFEQTFLEHEGKLHPLKLLMADKMADAALFLLPEGLTLNSFPYRLGNSSKLEAGNFLYTVGQPGNWSLSVREGIIGSVAGDIFTVSNGLNPGESGGAVIGIRDGEYELVGVAWSSFFNRQRLGVVIGINVFRDLFLADPNIPAEFKEFLKSASRE